jgi:hypothetical protein
MGYLVRIVIMRRVAAWGLAAAMGVFGAVLGAVPAQAGTTWSLNEPFRVTSGGCV